MILDFLADELRKLCDSSTSTISDRATWSISLATDATKLSCSSKAFRLREDIDTTRVKRFSSIQDLALNPRSARTGESVFSTSVRMAAWCRCQPRLSVPISGASPASCFGAMKVTRNGGLPGASRAVNFSTIS